MGAHIQKKRSRRPGKSVFSETEWERIRRSLDLSPREHEIVRDLFDGKQRQSIANSIGCSVHTVNSHFRRLFRKADVTSSVELVVLIIAEFRRRDLDDTHAARRRSGDSA